MFLFRTNLRKGVYISPLCKVGPMPLKLEHLFSEQKCLLTAEAFCVVLDLEKEFHDLTIHPPPLERNAVVHDQPMQEIVDFRAEIGRAHV